MSSNDDFCFHYDYAGRYVIGSDDNLTYGNGVINKNIVHAFLPRQNNGIQVYGTGYRSFMAIQSLKTVVVPNSYKYVDHDSFQGCLSLESVVFEDGIDLEMIGYWLLVNANITTFTFPASVKKIHLSSIFSGCKKLKSIYYRGMMKINEESEAFRDVPDDMKIYVRRDYPYSEFGGRKVTKILDFPKHISCKRNAHVCTLFYMTQILIYTYS